MPEFALEGAQAAADFDAKSLQETTANGKVVDACGNFHGVEHGKLAPLLSGVADADCRETGAKRGVLARVAGKTRVEPFFEHQP